MRYLASRVEACHFKEGHTRRIFPVKYLAIVLTFQMGKNTNDGSAAFIS